MKILLTVILMAARAFGVQPYNNTLGGSQLDQGWSIAVDSVGNAWIAGLTYSANFPAFPGFRGGPTDAFVAKFYPDGSLAWSTILGGSSTDGTVPYQTPAIALDSLGNAWVTGSTNSADFPVISGGAGCGRNPGVFVAKLATSGDVLFSGCFGTYWGWGSAITVDRFNNPWVTGTMNGHAYVLSLDSSGKSLKLVTLDNTDRSSGIAVTAIGTIVVAGVTTSTSFAATNGSSCTLSPVGACYDGFVATLHPDLSVIFSRHIGTSADDEIRALSVDAAGNIYIAEQTSVPGQPEHGFVASLAPGGSLRYYKALAGESRDSTWAVAADSAGGAWVGGWSLSSTLFPNSPPSYESSFLVRLSPAGTAFSCTQRFSNEIRGLALGAPGSVYLTGITGADPVDAWVQRVTDAQAPQIAVALTPSIIEAVNHKLLDITANVTVSDFCDPAPRIELVSISSNEPDDGLGDGDTPNDIQDAAFGADDR